MLNHHNMRVPFIGPLLEAASVIFPKKINSMTLWSVVVNSMFLAKKSAKNWILFRHEEPGLLNFVRSTAASVRPGIHP